MAPRRKDPPVAYEKRILAFVDILGWSALLRESESDPTAFNAALSAMDSVQLVSRRLTSRTLKELGIEATHFSDTLVVSAPLSDAKAIWVFSTMVHLLCYSLLVSHKRYTRGAIVVGDLIHTSGRIVGPALVNAYQIESQIAKYPRIIVTAEAEKIMNDHNKNGASITRTDRDGLAFLEIVPYRRSAILETMPPGADGAQTIFAVDLVRSCQEIREWILPLREKDQRNLNLYAKHSWMLSYLDSVQIDMLDCLAEMQESLDAQEPKS